MKLCVSTQPIQPLHQFTNPPPTFLTYPNLKNIVKLQAKSLRLGVDFVLPLSQEQEQEEEEQEEEEPSPKSIKRGSARWLKFETQTNQLSLGG